MSSLSPSLVVLQCTEGFHFLAHTTTDLGTRRRVGKYNAGKKSDAHKPISMEEKLMQIISGLFIDYLSAEV